MEIADLQDSKSLQGGRQIPDGDWNVLDYGVLGFIVDRQVGSSYNQPTTNYQTRDPEEFSPVQILLLPKIRRSRAMDTSQ